MQEDNKVKKSFNQNMKAELKKVIWPTGKQVVKSTFATIGFVLLITIVLVILNFTFSFLNKTWFNFVMKDKNKTQNEQVIGTSGEQISGEKLSGEQLSGEEGFIDENPDAILNDEAISGNLDNEDVSSGDNITE